MMYKPKISVIVPVYNVEKYISDCLESLVNQTFTDLEIICVNDGSPDNSAAIIEKYAEKDNRIIIVNRENGGLSAARNDGLDLAKGKYILFLDSDDFITEDALEKLYILAEKENLDILYFGVQNYYDGNSFEDTDIREDKYYRRKNFFKNAVRGYELFERFLLEDMFICCVPFQFIKKEFLINSKIRFKEGMLHEDELFSPQLIVAAERTMVIEDKFYRRRIREESITTSKVSHKNFLGYFIAYTTLSAQNIYECNYTQEAKYALNMYIKKLYNTSKRVYSQLSIEECGLVEKNIPSTYRLLFNPIKDRYSILNSLEYKVGKIITYIPVKIYAVLNSLKEKGIKETWNTIRKYYFK